MLTTGACVCRVRLCSFSNLSLSLRVSVASAVITNANDGGSYRVRGILSLGTDAATGTRWREATRAQQPKNEAQAARRRFYRTREKNTLMFMAAPAEVAQCPGSRRR